jgi:putative membrane protein
MAQDKIDLRLAPPHDLKLGAAARARKATHYFPIHFPGDPMFTGKISKHVLHAALLALVCGPVAVHAQSAKSPAGSASEGSTGKSSSSSQGTQGAQPSGTASAGSSGSASASLSASDQRLLKDMAQANIAEIETGKLAQQKSQNDEVKNFAQRMIDDHGKALQDLQQVAQAKGVTLPTKPDVKHQAMAKALSALSGDQFDRRYMAQGGLADHRQTHQLLQRAQRATDPDVKQAAAQTLPVVDQHLNMAQQLQASIKSGGTSAGASGTAGATSSGTGGSVSSGTGNSVGSGASGSQGSTGGGASGSGSGK